jgi:NADH-quinone oxidoreductase subunit D
VPIRAQYIRVMFDEVTRILNHLLNIGTHALDIGAMTMVLYTFREREDLMDVLRGGVRRAHARPTTGRVASIATCPIRCRSTRRTASRTRRRSSELNEARKGACSISSRTSPIASRAIIDEYETLLTDNRIWKQRTVGIGVVSRRSAPCNWLQRPDAARLGHRVGPAQEAALRGLRPLDFDIPVGVNGDTYDRYLVRMEEMRQSNRIIKQCIDWLRKNPGPVISDNHKVAPPPARR